MQRGGQWVIFTVTDVERYPKTSFPTALVYGPTPTAELRLITCGGTFDTTRRSYDDNVVVYATERESCRMRRSGRTDDVVAKRYRLGRRIGSGGMGRVWLARDEVLRRSVAIKEVLLPEGLTEAEAVELRMRTLREARAAAGCRTRTSSRSTT